jgi:hypothetical protein
MKWHVAGLIAGAFRGSIATVQRFSPACMLCRPTGGRM